MVMTVSPLESRTTVTSLSCDDGDEFECPFDLLRNTAARVMTTPRTTPARRRTLKPLREEEFKRCGGCCCCRCCAVVVVVMRAALADIPETILILTTRFLVPPKKKKKKTVFSLVYEMDGNHVGGGERAASVVSERHAYVGLPLCMLSGVRECVLLCGVCSLRVPR